MTHFPHQNMPGVVQFIQAKDIPAGGANNWRPVALFGDVKEEVLCGMLLDRKKIIVFEI